MREIKFRAWCPNENEMYFVEKLPLKGEFIEDTMGVVVPFNYRNSEDKIEIYFEKSESYDALELMQYTGLKDKNGVEIYEEDIVLTSGGLQYEVVFDKCCYWLTNRNSIKTPLYQVFHYTMSDEPFEVIGNIYENPELLEEQK